VKVKTIILSTFSNGVVRILRYSILTGFVEKT